MSDQTFETGDRQVVVGWWLAMLLAVPSVAAAAEPPAVPMSLGQGTGGDGAWTCSSAAHSPTTIHVDEAAGPEGTPAAILEFKYVGDKYNWNWGTADTGSVSAAGCVAVRVTYRTNMPKGFPSLNLMVRESTDAGYWVPRGLPVSPNRFATVTLPFGEFTLPAWSKDANGKLDIDLINQVSIGVETGSPGNGRISISEIQLVPPGW
jgi:hypothetical protein